MTGLDVNIRRRRVARVVTELTGPANTVAVLVLSVAISSAPRTPAGIIMAIVATLFAAVIPFVYVVWRVKSGRLTDHHISVRTERTVPIIVGLASVAIGLTLILIAGAPSRLLALFITGLSGMIVVLLVTRRWKISVHLSAFAGAAVISGFAFNLPVGILIASFIPLVAWSRVELNDHTWPQVTAGTLAGLIVCGAVFPLSLHWLE
jgi:hypothetical protein